MRFEWDERKRESNLEKHGVDFADLEVLFSGDTVTLLDDRSAYDEHRFITFGLLNGLVLAVAPTETDETIRFISARKATKREEKAYFKAVWK